MQGHRVRWADADCRDASCAAQDGGSSACVTTALPTIRIRIAAPRELFAAARELHGSNSSHSPSGSDARVLDLRGCCGFCTPPPPPHTVLAYSPTPPPPPPTTTTPHRALHRHQRDSSPPPTQGAPRKQWRAGKANSMTMTTSTMAMTTKTSMQTTTKNLRLHQCHPRHAATWV